MAKKVTVVVSQGQSASPAKRKLEEDLVAALLFEQGLDVTVVPHLYDLTPDGTGMLCLSGVAGDMIVLSWLFPRAAHWTLDRNDVRGQVGVTLLAGDDDEDEDEAEELDEAAEAAASTVAERRAPSKRKIYCIDLRARDSAEPFLEEIRRIVAECSVHTVDLMGWINGAPKPEQVERFLEPGKAVAPADESNHNGAADENLNVVGQAQPQRIEEEAARRWYPVIDYSRCTNCLECLDFCLFGVYGADQADTILVEQPDNCRKGCPACSRVCPENAIIFPQHKTPVIAGSPDGAAGALKIDLSQLFGAPDAVDQAVLERDVELVAVGRDAVGDSVGMPKRRENETRGPNDELDDLIDELDGMSL